MSLAVPARDEYGNETETLDHCPLCGLTPHGYIWRHIADDCPAREVFAQRGALRQPRHELKQEVDLAIEHDRRERSEVAV